MWLDVCTDLLVLSPQSAAAAPSPVLGNIPPNDGMPGGPIPPGFFQVRAGLGPCAGQAGRRGQESGSVCHGLNTVALCWLRPCTLTSPTSPEAAEGRKGVSLRAGHGCALLYPGASVELLLEQSCSLSSPFLMSKLSFVSVLLLLSSPLFTFPVQTTDLRRN